MKSYDELKLEEKMAKRKCLKKQDEDRKKRSVSNGEKQFLEREIRIHNRVIRYYKKEIEKLKKEKK